MTDDFLRSDQERQELQRLLVVVESSSTDPADRLIAKGLLLGIAWECGDKRVDDLVSDVVLTTIEKTGQLDALNPQPWTSIKTAERGEL